MIACVIILPGAFDLGRLVATPAALALAESLEEFAPFLARHAAGDGGDLCDEDKQANAHAIEHGLRVLSAYAINGEKFWIITEADRSSTTILLPEDY